MKLALYAAVAAVAVQIAHADSEYKCFCSDSDQDFNDDRWFPFLAWNSGDGDIDVTLIGDDSPTNFGAQAGGYTSNLTCAGVLGMITHPTQLSDNHELYNLGGNGSNYTNMSSCGDYQTGLAAIASDDSTDVSGEAKLVQYWLKTYCCGDYWMPTDDLCESGVFDWDRTEAEAGGWLSENVTAATCGERNAWVFMFLSYLMDTSSSSYDRASLTTSNEEAWNTYWSAELEDYFSQFETIMAADTTEPFTDWYDGINFADLAKCCTTASGGGSTDDDDDLVAAVGLAIGVLIAIIIAAVVAGCCCFAIGAYVLVKFVFKQAPADPNGAQQGGATQSV